MVEKASRESSVSSIIGIIMILVGIVAFLFAPTIELGGLNSFMLFIAQIVGVLIAIIGAFILVKGIATGISGMLK